MKSILITGGAGFIGVNSATHFSKKGWQVTVVDNLSRQGTVENLDWLRSHSTVSFEKTDIRNQDLVDDIIQKIKPDAILHLAAQVAVTTSVRNPRLDFEINALGTFNLLEAIRRFSPTTLFINASTNKVYGKMDEHVVVERLGRYEYESLTDGVNEKQMLDFLSPYGCSKGLADQYTLDYHRIYDLRTMSFRQSCIYGPRQLGVEDQGWVAWFIIAATLNKNITIYGDGKQIRDVLHVQDLVEAYEAAITNQQKLIGKAVNIGGGPDNTLSLLELVKYLEDKLESKIPLAWDDARPGDQKVFFCDIGLAQGLLGWKPKISVDQGLNSLIDWVSDKRDIFVSQAR